MNIVAEEQQPLLSPTSQDPEYGLSVKQNEALVGFENGDVDDPRQWTPKFKWSIVLLLACMAFNVTFTCIGVVPVASSIASDLSGSKNPPSSTSALLVTIWELGEAAGPLLIAPLSETFGRYPVINVCNVAFVLSTLLAASSQSTGLFIAARMLTGLSVGTNVLSPAIIGDMFESEKRGSAMSLIMLAPLIGGAVGPAISGAIAQTLGWRQILLIAAGLAVCCEILFLTCFRETYKMSILKSRVAKLQQDTGDADFLTEAKSNHENIKKLWHSITRPFAVLSRSLVLLLLSSFGSVAFSYFYVMSISLPNILQDVYGFTPAQTGTAFMSFTIGSFGGVLLCNFSLDRIYIHLRGPCDPKGQPEYRLPMLIVGAILLPATVSFYGWSAHFRFPVGLLLLAVALLGFTIMLTIIPLSAYVVDAFGLYSASAMTGVIVIRCLMGTFLPLVTGPLADNLGYGPGFTCFGALSLSLAVLPMLIFRYGEKWRQRSEFTRNA